MNELQQQEQTTIRMVRYLKRLSMEVETIQKQLKSGEIKIRKGKGAKVDPEGGHGGDGNHTSPLSLMCDKNAERLLIPTGKKLTGRPLVKIPDFEPVDLENLKMRIFSAEFPNDVSVIDYEKSPTLENRFTLLIHIAALENNVTPGDLMDLHGITSDFLMGILKKMVDPDETKDKQMSARFLAMAFKLKFPEQSVKVGKAQQNNYFNFGSKHEAVKAVKNQLEGIIGDIEENAGEDEQRGSGAVMVGEREETASD